MQPSAWRPILPSRIEPARVFFFSSRRRHTRYWRDWSSDVCSSDLGDDRLVRIDQVRVGRLRAVAPGARVAAPPQLGRETAGTLDREPAVHADEPEVAVHRPLFVVDAGAQQLAGALLGTPLAAGIAQLAPLCPAPRPRPGLAQPPLAHSDRANRDRRRESGGQKRED